MAEYKETRDLVGIQTTTSKLNESIFFVMEEICAGLPRCKRQIKDSFFCETYLYLKSV